MSGLEASARERKIQSLLVCLTDVNDPESRRSILQRLLELIPNGHHPLLYCEQLPDAEIRLALRKRYIPILNDLKLRYDLKRLLHAARDDGSSQVDLEDAAHAIARLGANYTVTPQSTAQRLDELASPLFDRLAGTEDPEERLDVFRDFLFEEMKFTGNTEDYYRPENSFLPDVMNNRKGIPVSLSVLCVLLGRRVDLQFSGVNLPGHFIVRYDAGDFSIYMDPFNQGNLLTRQDCRDFLARQGLEIEAAYLKTTDSLTILKRMYRNLINYHATNGHSETEKKLRQHFSILENASMRRP